MNERELRDILDAHAAWLRGEGRLRADLSHETLEGVDLSGANLDGANLDGANLRRASLDGARLDGASLDGANLEGARLVGALLSGANLRDARLDGANLRGARLDGADLRGARLDGAILHHSQIPDGELVAWKKVEDKIIELRIPHAARRTGSLVGRKCRAEFAYVHRIEGGGPVTTWGLTYREGEMVHPDSYDDDIRIECTHGIHFFLTRAEAEEWQL